MTLLDEYKKYKENRETKINIDYAADEIKKKERQQLILKLLPRDTTNLRTNGYVYEFDHGNTHVEMADQENRLIVIMHNIAATDEEQEMIDDITPDWKILKRDGPILAAMIEREYNYYHGPINGPTEKSIGKLVEMLERRNNDRD
jgi:hypothetical protein